MQNFQMTFHVRHYLRRRDTSSHNFQVRQAIAVDVITDVIGVVRPQLHGMGANVHAYHIRWAQMQIRECAAFTPKRASGGVGGE
jgi:hypothetical protein